MRSEIVAIALPIATAVESDFADYVNNTSDNFSTFCNFRPNSERVQSLALSPLSGPFATSKKPSQVLAWGGFFRGDDGLREGATRSDRKNAGHDDRFALVNALVPFW